jgi:outer membrane protein OmpA-like peptidoglycan-associated protein
MKIISKNNLVGFIALLLVSTSTWAQNLECEASDFYNGGGKPCNDYIEPVKCVNLDITDSFDFDGLEMDFIWDMGDGQTEKGLEVKHCYEKGGRYTASLTVVDLVTKVTMKDELKVDVYIRGEFSLSFDEMNVQAGEAFEPTYSLSYPEGYEASNYFWSYGDGRFSCEEKPQITYNSANEFPLVFNVELVKETDVVYMCQQVLIDAKLADPTGGNLNEYFNNLEVESRFLQSIAHYQIIESKEKTFNLVNSINELQPGSSYNLLVFKGNIVIRSESFIVSDTSTDVEKNELLLQAASSILDKKPTHYATVVFELNNSEITKKVRKPLDKNVEMLNAYPFLQIMVGSYTHTGGSYSKNITLSRDRSQLIKSYLVKEGIDENRILIADPANQRALINTCVTKGCDYEDESLNRRSDFKVLGITESKNE